MFLTSRDLGVPPWSGGWENWPYRGMRFYLALKRESERCDAEEREQNRSEIMA
jgi:hypothetical protein